MILPIIRGTLLISLSHFILTVNSLILYFYSPIYFNDAREHGTPIQHQKNGLKEYGMTIGH